MSSYFTRIVVIGVWCLCQLTALGEEKKDAEPEVPPRVSSAGMKRVRENIKVIEQNTKDTIINLEATDKNVKTIQGELEDLSSLDKEHFELNKRYRDYVAEAEKELAKNQANIKKIEKYEKSMRAAIKGDVTAAQRQDLEKAQRDREDRERWIADAKVKMKRVKELQKEIQENVSQIESRRAALKDQLATWTERRKEYQRLLETFRQRKSELEKLAAN